MISLALIVSTLAASVVPGSASTHPRQVHDAVLGWLPLCAPSHIDSAAAKGGSKQLPAQKHECCTLACAASAGAASPPPAMASLAYAVLVTASVRHNSSLPIVHSRRGFGTLGGRGPPLTA